MDSKVKEALRGLCSQYGWCYGVCWRVDGDYGKLRMGAVYYEQQLGTTMEDALNHGQNILERTLGETALSNKHLWIIPDDCSSKGSLVSSSDSSRFLQTVVVIPAPPIGVLQFGSANKILENSEFINQVKCICQTPEFLLELQKKGDTCHGEAHDIKETSSFLISLQYPLFGCDSCKEIALEKQHLATSMPSSSSALSSHCSALTVDALPTVVQKGNPFMINSMFTFENHQPAAIENNFIASSNTWAQQDIMQISNSSQVSSHTISHQSNELLYLMEQQLKQIMGTQQLSLPSQYIPDGSEKFNAVCRGKSRQISKPSSDGLHSSHMSPIVDRVQISNKDLSEVPSFPPESLWDPEFLIFSEDLETEIAASSISNLDSTRVLNPLSHSLKRQNGISLTPVNDELLGSVTTSCAHSSDDDFASSVFSGLTDGPNESLVADCHGRVYGGKVYPDEATPLHLDNELFNGMVLDFKNCGKDHSCWDDIMPEQRVNCSNLSTVVLESIPEFDSDLTVGPEKEFLSDFGLEQMIDHVSGVSTNPKLSYNSSDIVNSIANLGSISQYSGATKGGSSTSFGSQVVSSGFPCHSKSTPALYPQYNLEKIMWRSSNCTNLKSQVSSWIDDCYSMDAASDITMQSKRTEEQVKVIKKRARPGESTRPRPKDRQLIQDRVKELRELVPNGSKCSIDALLDCTIKHMMYLQSVTKYAEKLKQIDEPKMIGEQNGVVLRDNSSGGGATWAFEVAGQTMVCPIMIEDLSPAGQMLVEMLCEERGLFFEIVDIIQGFGLTILKGAMEARDTKIWARFLVEANREVTRMQIFLSLVQLLQQTSSITPYGQSSKRSIENKVPPIDCSKQSPLPMPISLRDRLQ